MKKLLLFVAAALMAAGASAAYYIAGNGTASNNWCCGLDWEVAGCEMEAGIYSTTVPAGTYQFKVTEGTWTSAYGYTDVETSTSTPGYEDGGGNVKFTVSSEATIRVTFNGMNIILNSDVPFGEASIESWTVAGDVALMGSAWDVTDTNNDMQLVGGAYQLIKSGVSLEAGEYSYKMTANHSWGVKECPGAGDYKLTIDEAGTYKVTFSLDAQGTEGSAQAEKTTSADEANADAQTAIYKVVEDGKVYIVKDNVKYDLLGVLVK